MICDGCNKEHHIYCVSPPTKIIPDGAWFCPECQKKGKEMARIQCEDCVDTKQTASLLASLSVSDLLQVQSCGM